jgi:hypothetical protein
MFRLLRSHSIPSIAEQAAKSTSVVGPEGILSHPSNVIPSSLFSQVIYLTLPRLCANFSDSWSLRLLKKMPGVDKE